MEQVCEYEDKKGTATFENYEGAVCRNSGENLRWHLQKNETEFKSKRVVLDFVSAHWDPPNSREYHSVNFKVSVAVESRQMSPNRGVALSSSVL